MLKKNCDLFGQLQVQPLRNCRERQCLLCGSNYRVWGGEGVSFAKIYLPRFTTPELCSGSYLRSARLVVFSQLFLPLERWSWSSGDIFACLIFLFTIWPGFNTACTSTAFSGVNPQFHGCPGWQFKVHSCVERRVILLLTRLRHPMLALL